MYIPGGKPTPCLQFEGNLLTSDPAASPVISPCWPGAALAIGDATVGWINTAFRQMQRFEQRDYIRGWRMPTLIVSGAGRIVSSAAAERFAQSLDIAQLI